MADTAAQLAGFKASRNAYETNAKKELKKIPSGGRPDIVQADKSLFKLQSYLDEHRKLSRSISMLTPPAELATECEAAATFQELLLESIADLTALLQTHRNPPPTAKSAESAAAALSSGSHHGEIAVKLPKLQLDTFDGDPLKWEEFWDAFSSTIHENSKLSKVDKFKYLKSFLEGDALRMLNGYNLTAKSYDTVVDALARRFGNKDIAINAHFEAMLALPEASHNTADLQEVYQACETHIRSLVVLGLSEDVFGQVFTPIILSKMPKFVRMEILRENKGQPWTLTNLRELLRQEILVREMSDRTVNLQPKSSSNGQSRQGSSGKDAKRNKASAGGTTTTLLNGATSSGQAKSDVKCSFCGEKHFSDQCQKYKDAAARREKIKGSCYKCLRKGHNSRDCKSKNRPCVYCQKSGHHRSLCSEKFGSGQSSGGAHSSESSLLTSLNPDAPEFVPVHYASSRGSHHRAVLQTALADIVGPKGTTRARLLFDTASSRTFVRSQVSRRIKAKDLGEEYLNIAGFAATRRQSVTYKKVSFSVLCSDGSSIPIEAFETETISCAIPKAAVDAERFPIIKQVKLAEPQQSSSAEIGVDILVGCDFYYDFIGSSRLAVAKGLYLVESKLGFVLSGRVPTDDEDEKVLTLLLTESGAHAGSQPLLDISKIWDLEEIGIKDRADQVDDDVALQQFLSNVELKDGRYSVSWPWKQERSVLSNNFGLAMGQLKALFRRLKANPVLLETYDKSIKDQIARGVVEPAPDHRGGTVHYLPHHPVVRPDKETTKVRIVYNASAKSRKDEFSLNDCLFRGPVILEDLCGILIRFRIWPVAFSSDIEKAFLQIQLHESERDVVRFLWVKDANKAPTSENLVAYRFCRVPFGVISSPFLLAATVQHHMIKADTEVSRDIAGNTYVDNNISGCPSAENAIAYYREAKKLFQSCSMNLREWATNCQQFQDQLEAADKASSISPKVLGLKWSTQQDTLSCPTFSAEISQPLTKRQMLQILGKLYDPCGFFCAVTVTGKILMQKAWIDGTGWDEPLSDDLQLRWKSYESELMRIPSVNLDRGYGVEATNVSWELHTFCDASQDAFAAVVYLRGAAKGKIKTAFVMGKTRVKPLKGKITIPRMELLAAVVGVRLTAFVATELRQPLARKVLWSDSKCVLQWIPKKQIMPVFVENQLREIRKHNDLSFRYVPTEMNPADLASRGCALDVLDQTPIWWHGPDFLVEAEERWPNFKIEIDDTPLPEPVDSSMVVNTGTADVAGECIKIHQFSNVRKLVNTTAWVLRFVENARKKTSIKTPTISAAEYRRALLLLIKSRQELHFGGLWTVKPVPPIVYQLKLFKDNDNLIRSRGRLTHASIDEDSKTPILLPTKDHLTKLIVEEAHRSVAHAKTNHTLAYVQARFWIPKGRSVVRKIVHECLVCRRHDGPAFVPPEEPPLPKFRVTRSPPFQVVGMDYLGPLNIRTADGTEKVWICLFTCAAIRAIHLEVVSNMTTAEFLLCLRRFVAIHGRPSMIISDNASQFRQADRTLRAWWKKLQEDQETREWATENKLTWRFVTEAAPWMGGFYERLVGLVKNALKKTLGRRLVSIGELQTVIAEVASILNTRPLTYVGDEVEDTPLTPAHFLKPLNHGGFPMFNEEQDPDFATHRNASQSLISMWKRSQSLLNEFWKQWQNQYLLSLREREKGTLRGKQSASGPQIGSVVLIKEANQPRGLWRLGKVTALHASFDGQIRSASVLSKGHSLVRPLKLLYPLETDSTHGATPVLEPESPAVDADQSDGQGAQKDPVRPRRVAATKAAEKIRRQLDDEQEEQ